MAALRPGSPLSAARLRPSGSEARGPVEVTIDRVGVDGDGVAVLPDGSPLYLPRTLPGERVQATPDEARGRARAATVLTSSPERVEPPCPHFAACGGCALQHWQDASYAAWKRGLLRHALERAGFADPSVAALQRTPPHTRRRVELTLRRNGPAVLVGLHAARSDTVVDLRACQVLDPALFALTAPLREMLARLQGLRRAGSAVFNLLASGPDLLLRTDAPLTSADRTLLAGFAQAHGLPRIAWSDERRGRAGTPETACQLRPAETTLGGVPVRPPPGAFLQASPQGEAAIIAAVLAGLPRPLPARARVAEFFAGSGTLTFALAGEARVAAFEVDAAAAQALGDAANHAGLAGRIDVKRRDLVRQPLMAVELAGFAAAVLDPPYAGAAAQIEAIAAARLPVVIYVSCNPASLERDARILRQAGYRLLGATPIDQFLWSPRLESVAVFSSAPTR